MKKKKLVIAFLLAGMLTSMIAPAASATTTVGVCDYQVSATRVDLDANGAGRFAITVPAQFPQYNGVQFIVQLPEGADIDSISYNLPNGTAMSPSQITTLDDTRQYGFGYMRNGGSFDQALVCTIDLKYTGTGNATVSILQVQQYQQAGQDVNNLVNDTPVSVTLAASDEAMPTPEPETPTTEPAPTTTEAEPTTTEPDTPTTEPDTPATTEPGTPTTEPAPTTTEPEPTTTEPDTPTTELEPTTIEPEPATTEPEPTTVPPTLTPEPALPLLSSLSLSNGALSPAFDPAINDYAAAVPYGIDNITVLATTDSEGASIAVSLVQSIAVTRTTANKLMNLGVGENKISVIVTDADNASANTYYIILTRSGPGSSKRLALKKTVEGQLFADWCADASVAPDDIVGDMAFKAYAVAGDGAPYSGTPAATGTLGANGLVSFASDDFAEGWYAIAEDFTPMSLASKLFGAPDTLYIHFDGENFTGNNLTGFNYDGEYWSSDTFLNRSLKPNLEITYVVGGTKLVNPWCDDFIIREYFGTASYGKAFSSFCASYASESLGGDAYGSDPTRYAYYDKTSEFDIENPGVRERLITAFNYIYSKWGSLDQWPKANVDDPAGSTKFIGELVTWLLVHSDMTEAKSTAAGYGYIDKYVDEVIAYVDANPGSIVNGDVSDIVYLSNEGYPANKTLGCQPQVVPIYGTVPFDNKELIGEIGLMKTVEGQLFSYWCAEAGIDPDDLIGDIAFKIYDVAGDGASFSDPPYAIGTMNSFGIVTFASAKFAAGWYAIVEEFAAGSLAETIFAVPDTLYIEFDGAQITYVSMGGISGSTGLKALTSGPSYLNYNNKLNSELPNIVKTVEGQLFSFWCADAGVDPDDVIDGMVFKAYKVAGYGAPYGEPPYAIGTIDRDGLVTFSPALFAPGWYAITEGFAAGSMASKLYKIPDALYIEFDGMNIVGTNLDGFNYDGEYYANESLFDRAAKPNLSVSYRIGGTSMINPWNDDFFVREYFGPGAFGDDYPSFCAYYASNSLGRDAYHYFNKTAEFVDSNPGAKEKILAAYNYIYDTWGSLDKWPTVNHDVPEDSTKFIAQIATWLLLDFGMTEAKAATPGYAFIDKYVAEVVDFVKANPGYIGSGSVGDIVYLAHADYAGAGILACQPQIVPIYGGAWIDNNPADPRGKLRIIKTVDGQLFPDWCADADVDPDDIDGIIDSIVFKAYAVAGDGDADRSNLYATGKIGADGMVDFTPDRFEPGWYAIVEEFVAGGLAEQLFEAPGVMYVEFDGFKTVGANLYGFDYNGEYFASDTLFDRTVKPNLTVTYRINNGMPVANPWHDDFFVREYFGPGSFGKDFSSFCAYYNSNSLGGNAYHYFNKTAEFAAAHPGAKENILAAYNYVYDTWGSLDQWPKANVDDPAGSTKFIAQVATWLLADLGVTEAKSTRPGYEFIDKYVDEVVGFVKAHPGNMGNGDIADIVYLAHAAFTDENISECQPQIVPIYDGVLFDNETIKDADIEIEKEWSGYFASLPEAEQDKLRDGLSFTNGYTLGSGTVPAGTSVDFSEALPDSWAWVDADGMFEYYAEFASVQVDAGAPSNANNVSFVAGAGQSYVIVFKNEIKRRDISGTLKVEKHWTGDYADLQANGVLDALEASLVFGGYALGTPYTVGAGKPISFSETLPTSWNWTDTANGFRYTVEFVGVSVTGATNMGVGNSVAFTTGRNGNYTITFTNRIVKDDLRATLDVSKVWQGTERGGRTEAQLNSMITFVPTLGTHSNLVPGTVINGIGETINTISWVSSDGRTRYTIERVSVVVDGSSTATSLTIAEKGSHSVVFTNRVASADITGRLTVTSVWLSTGDKTTAELDAMLTFNPGLGVYNNLAPGTPYNAIGETINTASWLSADGRTRYTIERVSVVVDGSGTATSLTIAENGDHTIVFTNRVASADISGRLTVTSVWESTGDKTTAELDAMLTFNPGLGVYNNLAPGTAYNAIGETINTANWLSADGRTRYTIERVSVVVDGSGTATSLTIAENGDHTIVFTNKVTADNISGNLSVTKIWQGTERGGKTEAELNAMITFVPGLGSQSNLVPGTVISGIGETINTANWLSADGRTRYAIEQVSVVVDGSSTATSLAITEKGNHSIVFTNRVTADDISAKLTVTKVWQGAERGGKTEAELNAMITFVPGLGAQANLVPGSVISGIGEMINIASWDSSDGKTRYTIERVGVVVDGISSATTLTIAEKGNHAIVFTNRVSSDDISGKLNVTKVWQGTERGGKTEAELNAMILFNPGLGAQANLAPGTVISGIGETIVTSTWDSADGRTRYTIERVSVVVDGSASATTLTIAEKGDHTIVFTNRVAVDDISGRLTVSKVWQGAERGERTEAQLNAMITFTPGLGVQTNLVPGTVISGIGETINTATWNSADGKYRYTIEKVSAVVDGSGTATSLVIAEKGNHSIVFTNRVTSERITTEVIIKKNWQPPEIWAELQDVWYARAREELLENLEFSNGFHLDANTVEVGEEITVWEIQDRLEKWFYSSFPNGDFMFTVEFTDVKTDHANPADWVKTPGGNGVTFTPKEGEVITITFTNTFHKTPTPVLWNFMNFDIWEDHSGVLTHIDPSNPAYLAAYNAYVEAILDKYFRTSTDRFSNGYDYEFSGRWQIGHHFDYIENVPDTTGDPVFGNYTFDFMNIEIEITDYSGNPITKIGPYNDNRVDLGAEADRVYQVTFTNKVVIKV